MSVCASLCGFRLHFHDVFTGKQASNRILRGCSEAFEQMGRCCPELNKTPPIMLSGQHEAFDMNHKTARVKVKTPFRFLCDVQQNAALRLPAMATSALASRCFTGCAWNSCFTAASHATLHGNNVTKQQMDSERPQTFELNCCENTARQKRGADS